MLKNQPDSQDAVSDAPDAHVDYGRLSIYAAVGCNLIIIAYAGLLTFLPILPESSAKWVTEHQVPVIAGAASALLLLITRPLLAAAERADAIHKSLSDLPALRAAISDLSQNVARTTDVTIEWYPDTQPVPDFLADFMCSTTYLGFNVPTLTRYLIDLANGSARHELYIHPRVLSELRNVNWGQAKVFVTDCPRDSCVLFGWPSADTSAHAHCMIVRHGRSGNACWSASLKADSEYTRYLRQTFIDYYHGLPAVSLDARQKSAFINQLYADRMIENKHIFDGYFEFDSRRKELRFASELIKCAQSSLCAVDMIAPSEWLHDKAMREYASAYEDNRVDGMRRECIHVFRSETLLLDDCANEKRIEKVAKRREYYVQYIKLQTSLMGVRLLFVDARDRMAPRRNFVLVDDTVVFYHNEGRFLREQIKPTRPGVASFQEEVIEQHRNDFERVIKGARLYAPDEFGGYFIQAT